MPVPLHVVPSSIGPCIRHRVRRARRAADAAWGNRGCRDTQRNDHQGQSATPFGGEGFSPVNFLSRIVLRRMLGAPEQHVIAGLSWRGTISAEPYAIEVRRADDCASLRFGLQSGVMRVPEAALAVAVPPGPLITIVDITTRDASQSVSSQLFASLSRHSAQVFAHTAGWGRCRRLS